MGAYRNRTLTTDLHRVFNFILELDKLKSVLRKTKPLGCDRYENSAEHSWQVCMLALLLAKEAPQPIDIVRVIELLLVHDIPEIDCGDLIVYGPKDAETTEAEKKAAERIFGLLPEPHATWCLYRWEEYEARQSDEAIFAYAIDRLMPVLQNLRNHGQSWMENSVPIERVLSVNAVIGNALPSVWQHVQSLIHDFAAATRFVPDTAHTAQPGVLEGASANSPPATGHVPGHTGENPPP